MYIIGIGREPEPVSCWYEDLPIDPVVEGRLVRMAESMVETTIRIIDGFSRAGTSCLGEGGFLRMENPRDIGAKSVLRAMENLVAALEEGEPPALEQFDALPYPISDRIGGEHGSPSWISQAVRSMLSTQEKLSKWSSKRADESSASRPDAGGFERALGAVDELAGLLDGALRDYTAALGAYRRLVEAEAPSITRPKDYCIELAAAYSGAELDFSDGPANTEIFDYARIRHYYHALVLDEKVKSVESRPNVIRCSHRRRGWENTPISLDRAGDLKVTMRTNFGYGRSSYFHSILSYMGISVVNARLIVYYSGLKEKEYFETTNVYEVSEESFKACFDQSAAYKTELAQLGPAAFAEKYILGPVIELSRLLYTIASWKVFFQVTSISKLSGLLSGKASVWMPESDSLDEEDFELSTSEETAVRALASTVEWGENDWDAPSYDPEAAEEARAYLEIDEDHPLAPQVAKIDLARNLLTSLLEPMVGEARGRQKLLRLVDELIPVSEDYRVVHLEEYELHKYRTEKASLVLSLLPNLRRLSEMGKFGDDMKKAIGSLSYTCKRVAGQDREYVESRIDPRLAAVRGDLEEKSSALKDLKARIEKTGTGKGMSEDVLEWARGQQAKLERGCVGLKSELAALKGQKSFLMTYVSKQHDCACAAAQQ